MASTVLKSKSLSRRSNSLTVRTLTQKVKTARGRKISSVRWLQRQLNDPYVAMAQKGGYRSRAAFKLLELDDKFHFLRKGQRIVDLGAAPGGWTQIAGLRASAGHVVAVDLVEMDPLPGVTFLQLDFLDEAAPDKILNALPGKDVDVVLSDMAPSATGHNQTDHLRIMGLAEAAFDFALKVLAPNGVFVTKIFQGGSEHTFLKQVRQHFSFVRQIKPPASRKESAEMFIVATGFSREHPLST